ncbi:LOW QUALITY PROTEIN: hypothetical protein HMPREF0005_05802, partial [Achromobacter xylosoxidans C54]
APGKDCARIRRGASGPETGRGDAGVARIPGARSRGAAGTARGGRARYRTRPGPLAGWQVAGLRSPEAAAPCRGAVGGAV